MLVRLSEKVCLIHQQAPNTDQVPLTSSDKWHRNEENVPMPLFQGIKKKIFFHFNTSFIVGEEKKKRQYMEKTNKNQNNGS